jgi:hypothetical protein
MRTIQNDDVNLLYEPARNSKQLSLKREREAEKLWKLGPRPLPEFLKEIDRGADVFERLAVYAQLPGEFIRANAADKFLPPLFAIGGGRTNG